MAKAAERHVPVMGGNAHVVVVGGPPGVVDDAAARLRELEGRWSRFVITSEVSSLNAAAGPVAVSEETFRLVEAACAGWRSTAGAFDPMILDALQALGYDRSFEQVRRTDARPPWRRPSNGCGQVGLDPATRTVTLPEGCRFDPGGLGKGLAADIVATELMAAGAAGACVNVGGDVRVCGESPSGRAWPVGVDDPDRPGEMLACLMLDDGGVATSSRLVRAWGSHRHHLLDPATGLPADQGVAAVSVVADDATTAEFLTKAAFVLGAAAVRPHVAAAGAGALVVADDRRITLAGSWPVGSLAS